MLLSMANTKERAPHEGETLARLIREKYKGDGGQATFAANAKIVPSTVSHWVKFPRFPKGRWASVRDAMEANGMKASEIRDEPIVFSREKATQVEDLTPIVDEWSTDQLRNLRRILESSDSSRRDLLLFLKGRLSK